MAVSPVDYKISPIDTPVSPQNEDDNTEFSFETIPVICYN